MAGRGAAAARREEMYKPPSRATIIELGRRTADIQFAPDERWLTLDTQIAGRSGFLFIG